LNGRHSHLSQYRLLKRAFDLLASMALGAVLWPVLVLIAVLIRLDSPGPALFIQERAGRYHRPFRIYKFRTMRVDTPALSTEEMRASGLKLVTRVGHLLRKTSLDELPQLWNVLIGDMSFVGPRPALMTQERVLGLRDALGIQVLRPGITGLAQATGRDDLGDEEKVRRDHEYLQTLGFRTDLRIVLLTVLAVFQARGVR